MGYETEVQGKAKALSAAGAIRCHSSTQALGSQHVCAHTVVSEGQPVTPLSHWDWTGQERRTAVVSASGGWLPRGLLRKLLSPHQGRLGHAST